MIDYLPCRVLTVFSIKMVQKHSNLHLSDSSSVFFTSRGRWALGEWPFLRVSHSAIQSHPQLVGALPHESQLCSHRQVVCQTLRERWEAHQQEVSWHCFFLSLSSSFYFITLLFWVRLWCVWVQLSGMSPDVSGCVPTVHLAWIHAFVCWLWGGAGIG